MVVCAHDAHREGLLYQCHLLHLLVFALHGLGIEQFCVEQGRVALEMGIGAV